VPVNGGEPPPVVELLREFPARRVSTEEGELVQGLPVRLILKRERAEGVVDLGDAARFYPSDAALARWARSAPARLGDGNRDQTFPDSLPAGSRSRARGDERDGGRRLRRRLQQRELLAEDEALAAHALDVDGHERAELDKLLAQCVAPEPLRGRIQPGLSPTGLATSSVREPPYRRLITWLTYGKVPGLTLQCA
jgi:hypothetical protein